MLLLLVELLFLYTNVCLIFPYYIYLLYVPHIDTSLVFSVSIGQRFYYNHESLSNYLYLNLLPKIDIILHLHLSLLPLWYVYFLHILIHLWLKDLMLLLLVELLLLYINVHLVFLCFLCLLCVLHINIYHLSLVSM